MVSPMPYKRILLKLSGESLLGEYSFGVDLKAASHVARYLKDIRAAGIELGVVIGGGNLFRGLHLSEGGKAIPRTCADQMGMLATLMNGIALREALESIGCPAKMMSALDCPKVAESYQWHRAQEYLKQGIVVIFVGGTGNPYFTTDTAAALRASEIQADLLMKATKVSGIYSKDPIKYTDSIKYDTISYSQVLAEKLQVLDATAVTLCMQSRIPIFVFSMQRLETENIVDILSRPQLGTMVTEG